MTVPSLSEFFSLRVASKRGCIHAQTATGFDPTFDSYRFARAEYTPQKARSYKPQSGTKPCDFVGTTYVSIVLISGRVRSLLSDHGMTGWRTCPVELRDKQNQIVPDYHALQISGRCGPQDKSKRQRVFEIPGTEQGRPLKNLRPSWRWKGYYFDPQSWDGSDIFMPEGTTHKIITRSLKELLERERVTNIEFTPLAEYRMSEAEADPNWKPPPPYVPPQDIYTEEDDRASAAVQEAVIEIAGGSFDDQNVAVLFARFGDIGFEALRLGAKHVTMIEQVKERLEAIRRESRESGWESSVEVVEREPLSPRVMLGDVPTGVDTIIIHPPFHCFEDEEYNGLGVILGFHDRLVEDGRVILVTPVFSREKPPKFFHIAGFDIETYEWPPSRRFWVHVYKKRPFLPTEE